MVCLIVHRLQTFFALAGISLALLITVAPNAAWAEMPSHGGATISLTGDWETPDMDAVISIRQNGEVLYADLVQHDYTGLTSQDINNPDPAKRTRPLLGVRILDGLRRVKENRWKGGELYDPRTGKTYLSELKFLDQNRLKIIGCIGPGLCKGYVWRRVAG